MRRNSVSTNGINPVLVIYKCMHMLCNLLSICPYIWHCFLLRELIRPLRFVEVLQWHHNERGGVSNRQTHDCLLKRLFNQRKHQSFASLVFKFVRGIQRWPVNSPHKGPGTREMFPFDDVIMEIYRLLVLMMCQFPQIGTVMVIYTEAMFLQKGTGGSIKENANLTLNFPDLEITFPS